MQHYTPSEATQRAHSCPCLPPLRRPTAAGSLRLPPACSCLCWHHSTALFDQQTEAAMAGEDLRHWVLQNKLKAICEWPEQSSGWAGALFACAAQLPMH